MSKLDLDSALIEKLAKLLEETGLSEIEYESGGSRIRVARHVGGMATIAAASPAAAAPAPPAAASPAELARHPGAVTSPMVGTIYAAPEPGAEPYVRVGDSVKEGQTLLIVEAMKTMNPVAAPRAGKVTQILVNNGDPVEFGEPLLIIE